MFKTWIMTVSLAVPLLVTGAAYSQDNSLLQVDPMTQTAGSAESRDCATEANRMQNVVSNLPSGGRHDSTDAAEAALHVQEAQQYAAQGNQKACWDELGKAQFAVQ
jgi:hypothetical protein